MRFWRRLTERGREDCRNIRSVWEGGMQGKAFGVSDTCPFPATAGLGFSRRAPVAKRDFSETFPATLKPLQSMDVAALRIFRRAGGDGCRALALGLHPQFSKFTPREFFSIAFVLTYIYQPRRGPSIIGFCLHWAGGASSNKPKLHVEITYTY